MKSKQPVSDFRQRATRDHLAAVALELFANQHFDSVSIRDIGKAANINPAMIYYYFENKEDLFRVALETAVLEAFAFYAKHSERAQYHTATEAIDAWFDVHFQLYKKLRSVIKISVDSSTLQINKTDFSDPIKEFYCRESRILQDIIRRGLASGEFKFVDSKITAMMISVILDGILTRTFILDNFDIKEAVYEFKNLMRVYLRNY